jgi:hypothetical protein
MLESSGGRVSGIVRMPALGEATPDSAQLEQAYAGLHAEQGVVIMADGHGEY